MTQQADAVRAAQLAHGVFEHMESVFLELTSKCVQHATGSRPMTQEEAQDLADGLVKLASVARQAREAMEARGFALAMGRPA